MGRSTFLTNIGGPLIALFLSFGLGYFINFNFESLELLTRTGTSISDVILALASSIADVLAFASGTSNALVGIILAAALTPPLVTTGLFIGTGSYVLI